jgi:hypothetical protein
MNLELLQTIMYIWMNIWIKKKERSDGSSICNKKKPPHSMDPESNIPSDYGNCIEVDQCIW